MFAVLADCQEIDEEGKGEKGEDKGADPSRKVAMCHEESNLIIAGHVTVQDIFLPPW